MEVVCHYISEILSYLSKYSDALIVITSTFGVFVPLFIALLSLNKVSKEKTNELKIQSFRLFHEMIKCLDNLDVNNPVGLTEQEAIVFEMRNYPQYKDFTKTMLNTRIKKWSENEKYKELTQIARDTIDALD